MLPTAVHMSERAHGRIGGRRVTTMSATGAWLDRIRLTWRTCAKELSGFGVVGGVSFLIDLGVFQGLYAHLGTGAVTAKLISTLVSMTVAYVGHRYWSFSHRARTGLKREYLLFLAINGLTLLLGLAMVTVVRYPLAQDSALILQVTNIASIALGTAIRFFAYRRWVFPAESAPTTPPPLAVRLDDAA
jgi:putative flippase GtrA